MEEKNKKNWFKAKSHGYGWIPATWEGWVVTLLYACGAIVIGLNLRNLPYTPQSVVLGFSLPLLALSVLFLLFTKIKGEKLDWRWDGNDATKNPEARKKYIIFILLCAFIFGAGALVILIKLPPRLEQRLPTAPTSTAALSVYRNVKYGISFLYPKKYSLEEKETGNAQRASYTIELTEDNGVSAMTEVMPAGEPAPSITIVLYQNNADKQTAAQWITGTQNSNYKQAVNPFTIIQVAGLRALSYTWSGLYQGDTVVLEASGNIVTLTSTYIAPEDATRKDFWNVIVSSLQITATPHSITSEQAIKIIQNKFSALTEYSKDTLPPKAIQTLQTGSDWNVSFEMHGSGVPYVLNAQCYKVTSTGVVTKTGEYKHSNEVGGAKTISPVTCVPQGVSSPADPQIKVEAYIRSNISTLSPEKALLGGTFYVTEIAFQTGNQGIVKYEDGHNAYAASFTYFTGTDGKVTIQAFRILPE